MDQTQCIYLDVSSVKRLVKERENSDKYRIDELVVAIFLAKFCERLWKVECGIGFPLKNSQADSIPPISTSQLQEVKDILNAKTEQDHDIDVVIARHTPNSSERDGVGFQIKRFNTYQTDTTTDGLIKFIKGQELKYIKTDTALVILLETGGTTKFTQVRDSIDPKHFPFSKLYFVGLYGDKLRFVEVWPDLGKEEVGWSAV